MSDYLDDLKDNSDLISQLQLQHEQALEEIQSQFSLARQPITPEQKRPMIRLGDARSLRKFML